VRRPSTNLPPVSRVGAPDIVVDATRIRQALSGGTAARWPVG
jgi:hypothetical protein